MTKEPTRDNIQEAEPAFGFHARPVDGAMTARLGQHNLPAKQREHIPRRNGADNESGAGRRDQGGARFGAAERVVQEVGGDSFRWCSG